MFVVYGYEVWGSFVMQLWRTHTGSSQVALLVKNSPANAGDMKDVSLVSGSGGSPGGSMATYSSILAWRIPWTEEPGGLQSIGSHRVGHK